MGQHLVVCDGDFVRSVAVHQQLIMGLDDSCRFRELQARKCADCHVSLVAQEPGGHRANIARVVTINAEQDRGRVSSGRIPQLTASPIMDAVPDRKEHIVLVFHGKRIVEGGKDRTRVPKIGTRHRLRPQDIDDGCGQEGSADAVPADINQVNRKMVRADVVVTKRVTA